MSKRDDLYALYMSGQAIPCDPADYPSASPCPDGPRPHTHRYLGDHKQETVYTETPCPAWADGVHCYEVGTYVVSGEMSKRCACGKTVERKR